MYFIQGLTLFASIVRGWAGWQPIIFHDAVSHDANDPKPSDVRILPNVSIACVAVGVEEALSRPVFFLHLIKRQTRL
jgi:hypothetical protein